MQTKDSPTHVSHPRQPVFLTRNHPINTSGQYQYLIPFRLKSYSSLPNRKLIPKKSVLDNIYFLFFVRFCFHIINVYYRIKFAVPKNF